MDCLPSVGLTTSLPVHVSLSGSVTLFCFCSFWFPSFADIFELNSCLLVFVPCVSVFFSRFGSLFFFVLFSELFTP